MLIPALAVVVGVAVQAQTEPKKIPDGSVEIVASGCLKGRVFTATGRPEGEGVSRGPDVTGRSFRVAAPREVMDAVKKHNGDLVEVVGVVRESSLADNAPGMKVGGNTRVVVGAPTTVGDPRARPPVGNVVVMDVSSVRYLSDSCPIARD